MLSENILRWRGNIFDASTNSFGSLVRDGKGQDESDTTDSQPTSSGAEDGKPSSSDSDNKFKGQPLQHRRVETVGLGVLSFIYF